MSYDFIVIDDILSVSLTNQLEPAFGRGLAISNRAEFDDFLNGTQVADFALCDLRWREEEGIEKVDFDGLDAIAELDTTRKCPCVIVLTDGGTAYRHLIEEAKRARGIVMGGIYKMPSHAELVATIEAIRQGEWVWNIKPPGRDGKVVVDILGSRQFTPAGRIVSAMLDDVLQWKTLARKINRHEQRVKVSAKELVDALSTIGEKHLEGQPQTVLAAWIAENREYLQGWRRRVERRMIAAGLDPATGKPSL